MKRNALLIGALLVVVVAVAAPGIATGATLTPSGSTSTTGALAAGTSAVFQDDLGALTISCTTHTVILTSRNISQRTLDSTRTSITILAADNRYQQSDGRGGSVSCPYTFLGQSGLMGVQIRCNWGFTALNLTAGTIEIPAACIDLTATTGPIAGCSFVIGGFNVPVTLTNRTNPTAVSVSVMGARVPGVTHNRRTCSIIPSPANARQTETVVFPTTSLSNP